MYIFLFISIFLLFFTHSFVRWVVSGKKMPWKREKSNTKRKETQNDCLHPLNPRMKTKKYNINHFITTNPNPNPNNTKRQIYDLFPFLVFRIFPVVLNEKYELSNSHFHSFSEIDGMRYVYANSSDTLPA